MTFTAGALEDLLARPLQVETSAMPDPIALRVARRHRAAAVILRNLPSPRVRVEYAGGGTITAAELKRMLEPQTGPLRWLVFRPAVAERPTTIVPWEALSEAYELVSGTLTLRTTVTEDRVATWAEVTVDPEP